MLRSRMIVVALSALSIAIAVIVVALTNSPVSNMTPGARASSRLSEVRSTNEGESLRWALVDFANTSAYESLSDKDQDAVIAEIAELTANRADELFAKAESGSRFSFMELLEMNDRSNRLKEPLLPNSNVAGDSEYRQLVGEHFNPPRSWNDLVARFIEDPTPEEFQYPRPTPGELTAIAFTGLEKRDLTKIKLSLSWVWYGEGMRSALGQQLYGQLVHDLVHARHQLHEELGLAFPEQAPALSSFS